LKNRPAAPLPAVWVPEQEESAPAPAGVPAGLLAVHLYHIDCSCFSFYHLKCFAQIALRETVGFREKRFQNVFSEPHKL
jgi:hypothetical protein